MKAGGEDGVFMGIKKHHFARPGRDKMVFVNLLDGDLFQLTI